MSVMGRDYYSDKLKSPPLYEVSALTSAVNHLLKVPLSDPLFCWVQSLNPFQKAAYLSAFTELRHGPLYLQGDQHDKQE